MTEDIGQEKNMDTNERLGMIMKGLKLDMLLITDSYSMRYIAGYRGEGVICIAGDRRAVLTDSRYTEQVLRECPGYACVDIADGGYEGQLRKLACDIAFKKVDTTPEKLRIGFENKSISYDEYSRFSTALDGAELVCLDGAIAAMREVKTEDELDKLAVAESIGDAAFDYICGVIRPGMTEKEVALELEYYMKRHGAEGLSFDTIAASGVNSSMPHAIPTDKVLENGDFLTMDFGCIYEGYCSDMTRTVVIGRADDEMRRVYDTVLAAQTEAMKFIRPGAVCSDVDAAARRVIADAGYGEYFGHGLGHCVGLFIHENPRFSPKCSDTLKAGMVITVEPGIYLPGRFGVRIEDMVAVTEDGYVNLTKSDKSLMEICRENDDIK